MELSLADFVLYLLLGSFALAPLLTLLSRTLQNRVEKRALANRVICRLCLHAFEETSHIEVVDCPICGAANEKGRSRRLG
jgi:hypothetical protein